MAAGTAGLLPALPGISKAQVSQQGAPSALPVRTSSPGAGGRTSTQILQLLGLSRL